jgi:hypothetical protein
MIKGLHKNILTSKTIQLALIFHYEKGGRCILDVQMKLVELDIELLILETIKKGIINKMDIKQIEKYIEDSECFTAELLDGYSQDKKSKSNILKKIQTEIEECIEVRDSIKHTLVDSYNHVIQNTKDQLTPSTLGKIVNQTKN